jgi:hypothetical protein
MSNNELAAASWKADPLTWGKGPRVFEMFLEPTCPFSVKAFGKLDALVQEADADRVTVKVRLHSQPWHMYSGVLVRCILAASTLPGGKETAKSVMAAIAAHREEFEFARHCGGPNMDATPNDIIARLERYSGVALREAFAIPDLEREIKWHSKYARQNGIHSSPTFMIDGLVDANLSSGDDVSVWAEPLQQALNLQITFAGTRSGSGAISKYYRALILISAVCNASTPLRLSVEKCFSPVPRGSAVSLREKE